MSKEMTVIALGLWIVVVTQLGIPGEVRVVLLVLSGLGVAVTGFLLRGEALSRGHAPRKHDSFVESALPTHAHEEHKEGIGSLN